MSAFVVRFLQTFFQQIPNCVCLIFAIGSLVALVFMLPKRRHHGRFYALLWGAFLFIGLWRCFKGIISIRYASIMIYPMVIATAFASVRAEAWWRLLCRHFPRLPRWFGRFVALACLVGCTGGALLISRHMLNSQARAYKTIYAAISEYRQQYPDIRVLIKGNDAERITYYTKVPCISLEENQRNLFMRSLNGITEPDRHILAVVTDRHRVTLDPRKGELRPGAKLSLVRKKHFREVKRKGISVYFYRSPLSFSRVTGKPPVLPPVRGGLARPDAFGPTRFAKSLRSRPLKGGGGFRFTFVISTDAPSGKAPAVEIRTARRRGKKEVGTLQMRCPVPEKGTYRGVVTFRVPAGPFTLCLNGRGTAVRLEQFRLTRAE